MKRRVLLDMRIDKIAAVDSPCQEHAMMTIIKRAHIPVSKAIGFVGDPVEIGKALGLMQGLIDENTAALAAMNLCGDDGVKRREVTNMADGFPAAVAAIMKRDGCSRLRAMEKAATEHPDALEAYRAVERSDEAGPVLKAAVAKRAFDACVAEIAKRGVTRLRAMEIACEEHPAEFEALRGN